MDNTDFKVLYTEQDRQILKIAEDTLDPSLDRVQEIVEYAKGANLRKIGIAHCITFNRESAQLEEILLREGFEVEKVNCKYGRVPFSDLVEGYRGISCNPAGQAKYLEEKKTELNIMMGLCVGHDMIFNSKSAVPVTPLLVKDRKLAHNPIERLRKEA
jgi:uncharacterized metal-binding protein